MSRHGFAPGRARPRKRPRHDRLRRRRPAEGRRPRHARRVRDLALGEAGVRARERPQLRILKGGDAGEVVTRALLTAGNPEGDVLFGVDNNLVERALDGRRLRAVRAAGARHGRSGARARPRAPRDADRPRRGVPQRRQGLVRGEGPCPAPLARRPHAARYRNQLVVENPATSTPGLAFMLATIARFGESAGRASGAKLRANGVLVVDGWEEAYTARFSGAAGSHGTRPIVVSYASSPPAEVIFRDPRPKTAPTGVVEPTAASGRSSSRASSAEPDNENGARELIDFMLSTPLPAGHPAADVRLPGSP